MDKKEIFIKIQELLESGQLSNASLALELIKSQLKTDLKDVLQNLNRPYLNKKNSRTGEDFYLTLRLGPLVLEYEYIKRYAPYVGSIERASRKVGFEQQGKIQYRDDMTQYWKVNEWSTEQVKTLFEADYLHLIPYLADSIISALN